jgi:hypothetical protein
MVLVPERTLTGCPLMLCHSEWGIPVFIILQSFRYRYTGITHKFNVWFLVTGIFKISLFSLFLIFFSERKQRLPVP